MDPVRIDRDGEIARIVVANPPVNALSQAVRRGLLAAVSTVGTDSGIAAAVLMCEGRTFIAGADIREFDGPPLTPTLPEVCDAIEACPRPIVAAIHGTALGGGLEVALAAHGRVMAEGAKAGLPEVTLGIIPGAGGTWRLPRLIDAAAALEMVASGRPVPAARAHELGLADVVVAEGELVAAAVRLARSLAGRPPRRAGTLPVRLADRAAFDTAASKALARARGQASIGAAVGQVTAALDLLPEEAARRERATFLELRQSAEARALRHLFFAERAKGRAGERDGASPRPVACVGVVGAGTMGAGIAGVLAAAGLAVTLVDPDAGARQRAEARIATILGRAGVPGRIAASADLASLAASDLVVEAAFEDLAVKCALMGSLGALLRPGAVIATNTSYLDVGLLAEASGRPGDVLGLHFFAPPEVMRLIEVVRHAGVADDTLATGLSLAARLKKIAVVVGVCDGFVGNRILALWRREMEYALEDGALPHEVDAAMEAFGFALGPFKVSDLSGLDIAWARRKRLAPTRDPAERYVPIADRLCEMGRLGRKTGAGWYAYEDGRPVADPLVARLVEEAGAEREILRRKVPAEEIQARARAALVNEAAKILEEGIAARPSDIDLILVHGYGYPAWRGGPMFDADRTGLARILADVERLHAANGVGFAPAPLLVRLAQRGQGFADWARETGRG